MFLICLSRELCSMRRSGENVDDIGGRLLQVLFEALLVLDHLLLLRVGERLLRCLEMLYKLICDA